MTCGPHSSVQGVHTSRLVDAPPQPWRNGGGLTHSLLAWPPGAAGGDWLLRVSVAHIEQDGPFSRFADVARAFAVLRGAGVRLQLPAPPAAPIALRPGDAPLHFDGASAPGCSLLGGPTQDLNLMAHHRAGRPRMANASPGSVLAAATPSATLRWRGLYSTGPQRLYIDGQALDLAADTLAWSDTNPSATWQLDLATTRPSGPTTPHPAPAWWLCLEGPA